MMRPVHHFLALVLLPLPAGAAIDLDLPGSAARTLFEQSEFGSYNLPIGPSAGAKAPTIVAEGPIEKTAWRAETGGAATVSVMDNLRQQIERRGFELLYECETRDCGGFDFRFDTLVLPEPAMHVDLGDFRFLSAQRLGQASPEYLSLLVSRSAEFAYIQMIHVGGVTTEPPVPTIDEPVEIEPAQTVAVPPPPTAPTTSDGVGIVELLEREGRAVLDDLVFETGSSSLGDGPFASLVALSEFLNANPSLRIALVGHTDSKGSLQGNIALSKRRASAVAARLIESFDVPEERISADGVGFLAPRTSNQTEEGRNRNRRVEVVITTAN